MNGACLAIRQWNRAHDEGHLRCLLDGPHSADESDATRDREDAPEAARRVVRSERRELRDRGLHRGHLAEIDESRERSDCTREERRPGARRAHDEDESVVETSEALAERCPSPGSQPLRDTQLVRRRLDKAVHARDSRSATQTAVDITCRLIESGATSAPHASGIGTS